MKWEILKGSEKDFEGAPEWSLMLLKHAHSGKNAFSESNIKGARRTDLHDGMFDSEIMHPEDFLIIAERRPITEPVVNQQLTTEWDGEGLPPVGLVVETANRYKFNVRPTVPDDATRVRIVAHAQASNGTPVAIYQWNDEEGAVCVEATVGGMFRPIRSPVDVERDDFIKKLSGNVIEGVSIGTRFAGALYDAGYRKVE